MQLPNQENVSITRKRVYIGLTENTFKELYNEHLSTTKITKTAPHSPRTSGNYRRKTSPLNLAGQ